MEGDAGRLERCHGAVRGGDRQVAILEGGLFRDGGNHVAVLGRQAVPDAAAHPDAAGRAEPERDVVDVLGDLENLVAHHQVDREGNAVDGAAAEALIKLGEAQRDRHAARGLHHARHVGAPSADLLSLDVRESVYWRLADKQVGIQVMEEQRLDAVALRFFIERRHFGHDALYQ
jgi:hypothetical protein